MAHRGRGNADDPLAAALAAGRTVRDAAATAGVSERTAYRRLADEAFATRVAHLRGQMIGRAAGRLADAMGEASDVLRALLASGDEHVRHKAGVKVIELGLKVAEVAELERRVAALELRSGAGEAGS
ncbi:MAG TPA: hypothetical protein VM597_13665 [Gemmataceae bacterium]|nr:hypothetical protein [Gemmataceae bacterium]